MDKFFSQNNCDRCGESLKNGRTMSMFNMDAICLACAENEKKEKDFQKALEADHEQIKCGNYNYKGIRG